MTAAVATWDNLSTQPTPSWPAAGLVLALHALLIWGVPQAQQPAQRLDFGSPMMVRLIVAPPAPKPVAPPPAPDVKPAPKAEPVPKPELEPKPKVERPLEPIKPPEPEKKPLITQNRSEPVPMEPAPLPQPQPRPQRQPSAPKHSVAEPAPEPPRSAPVADTARQAPVTPPNVMAAYQNNPPPVYPLRSRSLGEEGQVLLRVHITADGSVDQIEVERSSGYERLDQAALEAVRDWRFAPARRGDEPVGAWVLVPIHFKMS
ncbi:MAG: energy transducer TonB [Nitrococcus sp.]|nr:energy transducer TonB [Nitrococcus sp.]